MNPPAFQLYADDLIAGTVDLSQAELGAYMRLLCAQWSKGYLPDDMTKLERIAGGPVTEDVLSKLPLCSDGQRRNHRMEIERGKQAAYRQEQSEKGRAGAAARWHRHGRGNGTGNATAIAQALPKPMAQASFCQWPGDGSPSPSPSPEYSSYPKEELKLEGEGVGEDRAVRPAGAGPAEIDSKFLESLRKDPAYSGIDVDRELGKCRRWCEVHRKVASRRRFVSWLNRVERPIVDLSATARRPLASIRSDFAGISRWPTSNEDRERKLNELRAEAKAEHGVDL